MDKDYQLSAYHYHLPHENIAQQPAGQRDHSRLLILDCPAEKTSHRRFNEIIELLKPEDLLVVNNSRVFPARFTGHKATGGKVEMFLLHYPILKGTDKEWTQWLEAEVLALLKSSKRPKIGSTLLFADDFKARVDEILEEGKVKLILLFCPHAGESLDDLLTRYGQIPLPPYIDRPHGSSEEDRHRYQTRYAERTGSVAAPTAGLHFSDSLLETIRVKGITIATVTLHVGYGTFAPVRSEDIRDHRIHAEYIDVSEDTALCINHVKKKGGRIWAVGTTTARALEAVSDEQGIVRPWQGLCDLYIYPGYRFKVVQNLITNFHLPCSSLLFLVSALAGRHRILDTYLEAVGHGYRFYSYGDAMAIITRK
jgi:S-adenosylmethionine:tRNA ribosyltransferase-isomerase